MKIQFDSNLAYQKQVKETKANLIHRAKEMLRGDPAIGIGKPEPLQHGLAGLWSQRDRVIYRFDDHAIYILAIGGHYDDH